ncbi:uncharacterized protein LOC133831634 [Humulus lupulus]|uniref:uncharacterized protein LOC133831634 n=1 Tax=Humulus lupulus TaxID=3486 RepID=UPI002B405023|nr:uncharacterized protein LOC133831634 [Humulus lupulus]
MPRRNTRAGAPVNSTVELPAETGNNRALATARTQNPGNTQNVPELAQANSAPSRRQNGWQPPSPIRHPPSPIRYLSPPRRNTQLTQGDKERRAGQKQGNGKIAREQRGAQPTRSQMSRSHTIETRQPERNPSQNNHATSLASEGSEDTRSALITISHAQHRAVDYKELVKVLNDHLVESQAKIEHLTKSEKDLQEKTEQAEKLVADRDRALKELTDENNKLIQTIKKLTDQQEKNVQEIEELKQDKEADLARYEEIYFNCFYQIWKLNKPFNLEFLSEEEKAKELAKCEAKAAEEAALPAGIVPASSALSFRLEEAPDDEGVDQPRNNLSDQ